MREPLLRLVQIDCLSTTLICLQEGWSASVERGCMEIVVCLHNPDPHPGVQEVCLQANRVPGSESFQSSGVVASCVYTHAHVQGECVYTELTTWEFAARARRGCLVNGSHSSSVPPLPSLQGTDAPWQCQGCCEQVRGKSWHSVHDQGRPCRKSLQGIREGGWV